MMKNKKNKIKKKTQKPKPNERRNKKNKKKKKKKEGTQPTKTVEKKEKKWLKVATDPDNGSLHVCLITKMSLKTELWKLKIAKCVFSFHNS